MKPKLWAPVGEAWQPDKLLFRDTQFRQLIAYATHPVPTNCYLQGDQGLGKTLTTKFFENEICVTGQGKVFTIPWERKMEMALHAANLNLALNIPRIDESASGFARAMMQQTDADQTVYLVIDEPEKTHRMRYVSDFIHSFYNTMVQAKRQFCIIMATRMIFPYFRKVMAEDTLSRLRPRSIIFPAYTAPEIIEILKQRLDAMFDAPVPYRTASLAVLAEHICRIGGDMRQALAILGHALTEGDDFLTVEVMHKAVAWGKNQWWLNQLLTLHSHQAFLLYAAALQTNNGDTTLQKYVVNRYNRECAAFPTPVDPVGYTTMVYHFHQLARKGFIQLKDNIADKRDYVIAFDPNDKSHILQASQQIDWFSRLGEIKDLQQQTQVSLNPIW